MDMWKPFRVATGGMAESRDFIRQVPRHASSRRGARYRPQERNVRLAGRDRRYIKGQKYTL